MQSLFFLPFEVKTANNPEVLTHNQGFLTPRTRLLSYYPPDADIDIIKFEKTRIILKADRPCKGFIIQEDGSWEERKLATDATPCKTCFKLLDCQKPCSEYNREVLGIS